MGAASLCQLRRAFGDKMTSMAHRLAIIVITSHLLVGVSGTFAPSSALPNSPPNPPVITEPAVDDQILNPADIHMATAPFSDPDSSDTHICTDWEIWSVGPIERV